MTAMTAEQQSLMAILRKHYGDTAVLEAISETGSIEAARKQLNRERQIARRKHKQAERREVRADQLLFRAVVVVIGPELADLLANAKRVRSDSSSHRMLRATCQRAISLDGVQHGNRNNNLIVLWDLRAGEPMVGSVAACEMIWTGADYRLHCWRRSVSTDSRAPSQIELVPVEPQYPAMPPQSAPVPAWADDLDLSDLRIEKKAVLED